MKRIRTIAIAGLVVALLQVAAVAMPARAEGDTFSRLQLTLSTTSDWATVTLEGVEVRVQRTASSTPGAEYWAKPTEWTLATGPEGSGVAVVDLVIEVDDGAAPRVVLRKGMVGTATVELATRNGPVAEDAAHVHLDTNDKRSNVVAEPLDRDALDVGGLAVPLVDDRRLTLAFYYPWFDADAPKDRRIGIDKPVVPFATSHAPSAAAMVDQAVDAGIDGFVVSWEGRAHQGPVDLLFDAVAARPGFAVAPLLELRRFRSSSLLFGSRFDPAAAAAATREFLDRAPAGSLLEQDGRRVLMTFGMWDLSVDEWAAYRARVADLDLFLVGDRSQPGYAVDGIYDYDPNSLSAWGLQRRSDEAVNTARLRPLIDPGLTPKLWAATVSPGYDTRASQPLWKARWTPREGGARYDMTWSVALGARPDWVLITSWNEWYEQTHIAPGSRTGLLALSQTARWTDRYGSSAPTGG